VSVERSSLKERVEGESGSVGTKPHAASPPDTQHCQFSVPARADAVSSAVEQVLPRLEAVGAEPDDLQAIESALREALANAIVHGCKRDARKVITGNLDVRGGVVRLSVLDPGEGFDPSTIPDPLHPDNLHSDHGRGIYLIYRLMDEVRFARGGSEIVMTKRLRSKPRPESKASSSKRFEAEMPGVPGVAQAQTRSILHPPRLWTALVIAAILLSAASGLWRLWRTAPLPQSSSNAVAGSTASAAVDEAPPAPTKAVPKGNDIGSVAELSQPWAAREFSYTLPATGEEVPALVVRLPGNQPGGGLFWGLLLEEPYGRCTLEYVTDSGILERQFGYTATHPMIVDPCNGAVFDPLVMGTLSDGVWARGELVKGPGLRPPLGIEIRVEGGRLVAGHAEQ
jgi:serine/threonine-protein kinase RsbW